MSKVLTNVNVALLAVIVGAIGIALLLVAPQLPRAWGSEQAFIEQLGGLLVATGLVTFGWELVGKRSFAREVMDMVHLSADLKRSGIVRVSNRYLSDPELWSELFNDADKLDIVVAYARTWRNTHHEDIRRVAKNPRARIRVFLPDPSDQLTLRTLAQRFDTTPERLENEIRDAIADFQSMSNPTGCAVHVYLRKGDLLYACYRFGRDRAVITLYSHAQTRQSVPMFVIQGGELFEFIYGDLEGIAKNSVEVPSPK